MEDAMKGWHNFIMENQLLHQLEKEIAHLTILLHEEQNKNATAHYMGYQQGWNDCEKKIRNFMKRHCERWKDE